MVGAAAVGGARLRGMASQSGPGCGGPRHGSAALPGTAGHALLAFRTGYRRADERRGQPPRRGSTGHLPDLGRPASSHLRVGEAIGLDRSEVDLTDGRLTVSHTNFSKSRLLPLHGTTTAELGDYLATRDRLAPKGPARAAFISPARQPAIRLERREHLPHLGGRSGLRPGRQPAAYARSCRPPGYADLGATVLWLTG
jgi:hypothetical protein